MRLSDVLSKPITTDYVQIEGFLGSRKLKTGNSKGYEFLRVVFLDFGKSSSFLYV